MPDELSWKPSATLAMLQHRSAILAKIRAFFNARGYLEVETPILAHYGITDVYLSNIKATVQGQIACLQTSPEYHMKRLLAAGSGSIFQLARVFRDDELGRWHNPEFTLLEWYRLNACHHTLMDEMDEFLQYLFSTPPLMRKTYQHVFMEICDIDPLHADVHALKSCVAKWDLGNVLPPDEQDIDQYLFLLMSHVVEKALAKQSEPIAIYNFPASQASLAKIHEGVAERFEVYYRGVELANGFHELTDATLQRERFQSDNQVRLARGLPQCTPDAYLLSALESGLPPCSGVALGIDRLLALTSHHASIAPTLAFDFSRA